MCKEPSMAGPQHTWLPFGWSLRERQCKGIIAAAAAYKSTGWAGIPPVICW